jgi:hypothetical protein
MNVSRRGLLGMFAAAAAAPYIPAGILMPVRKIIVPSYDIEVVPLHAVDKDVARAFSLALSAIVMREGRLHSLVQELVKPGGLLSPGDELRALQLQPGDQVLKVALQQQAITGTGWVQVSMRELPTKGRSEP